MKWSHGNEEEIADIKLIIKTKGISDIIWILVVIYFE